MAAEITQIDTQNFTTQTYGGQDTNLLSSFDVSTSLSTGSYIEYFIYDNNQNLLSSEYNFTQYTIQNDGQSAGNGGNINEIILNPEQSLINNGFDQGEYITYFNFFNKQLGSELQQLYITELSSDRTEIRLDSTSLTNIDIIEQTNKFIQEREASTYFLDFYLNFGENQLAIANNIELDTSDSNNPTILIKLYEALPDQFDLNSTLWVVTSVEEPRAYSVAFEEAPIIINDTVNVKGPNFNLDLKDQVNNSTIELSYIDLLTTSLTGSKNQLNSLLEEKELDINVDYTSFENFTHFSSVQNRLENFYYKIQLIEQYSSSIAILNNTTNSSSSINSSTTTYESKIDSIITNFDGYEYYLYYETGSTTWPKTNTQKPYILASSTSPTALTWLGSSVETNAYYGGMLLSASVYDNDNINNLYFSIPEYLREDSNNDQYLLFINMIGQFYDNIWIYYKDVTQKYNADNRLEYGISKDIVADAIRDFGIKLYQNNFSNQDLYTAFLGITPEGGLFPFPNITGSLPTPSGFEYVDTLISASNDYLPLDDVNKSLYKRIYHNLPYLLKSKGTLPGLRALITSYGIPDTILRINEFGGKDKVNSNDWDLWQDEFNYAFDTKGTNFISSSFELNPSWGGTCNPNNCDTILVTYTLVGEEPVTVEVEKNEDGNYYFNGYEIEKDGEEWLVNSSCEKEVVVGVSSYLGVESTGIAVKVDEYNGESVYLAITQNNIGDFPNIGVVFFDGTKWIQRSVNGNIDVAESTDFITWTSLLEGYEVISSIITTQPVDCISVNYGETTVELLKVGIFEGQNAYIKGFNPITNYFDYAIGFNYNNILYEDKWVLVVSGVFSGVTVTDIGSTYILPKSPFINPPISENWMFTDGEDLGSVTTTPCDCGELQATLSENTPCPFGTYTIEAGSIFEAFEVEPAECVSPPSTIEFRFKAEEFPPTYLSQSLMHLNGGGEITLQYTGSELTSGSYSGSIIDPYYQYANLIFYPSSSNLTISASVYLPFFNESWWSVMLTSGSNGYKLHAGNKIYEGGDNNTALGFYSSSSITSSYNCWNLTNTIYFATGSLFNRFSGSLQEIRYYTTPLSESVFKDYIMNPNSIEGNSLNSSPNELAFRAPLGGELYTGSISIHPKITGSWSLTQSFTSNSNFSFNSPPAFIPNTEFFFADQPVAGIKNIISDKIRIEGNVLPSGDTLSQYKALSQQANISQSYTPNINYLEVAFSPQNEINEDIMSQIGFFNIGEYIGDPRLRSSPAESYPALDQLRNEYFTKYIKNYNLVDFIRLIKFFDNSLFKMIKDFVPARTSLASGIVIKQHLLERNKYPQPQVNNHSTIAYYSSGSSPNISNNIPFIFQNILVSGTLKPTWNGYEEGTVEHFEGGTGGSFERFNLPTNISQSWTESINTPSGSVLIIHNSQDEFYNGELSGSNILISDGTLNPAYPNSNLSFDYTPIRYSPSGYNLNASSTFAQSQFLNPLTTPNQGEILLLSPWTQTFTIKGIPQTATGPRYVKIHKMDYNGVNNEIPLGQATQLLIKYSTLSNFSTLKILSINEYPTYYLYEVNTLGSNSADDYILDYKISASNAASFIPSSTITPTIFTLYNNISGNTLGYFDPNTGIHTLNNTPNIQISITGSVSVSNTGDGVFRIDLLRQGDITRLQFVNVSAGSSYSISASYYGLQGDQIYLSAIRGTGSPTFNNGSLLLTQSISPSSAEYDPIIIEPYITTTNFYNSDENALLNSVDSSRQSTFLQDVDYSFGITTPVNFNAIISGSATKATVPDSNYTTKRHIIPRYLGSRSTSQQLNTWTPGDTGTYGKVPTVESLKTFVAYSTTFGGWPPERMNASAITIKYLIDQNGNAFIPNTSQNSLPITQQNFQTGERIRITTPSQGTGVASQFRTIIKGGARIEPILYTQSGSAPNAQWNTTMSFEDIIPSDQGAVGNYTALFNKTVIDIVTSPNTEELIEFNNAIYGNSYLFSNGYKIPISAVQDGVNLTFSVDLNVKCFVDIFGTPTSVIGNDVEILLYKNSTLIASTISQLTSNNRVYFNHTVNSSDLQTDDLYKVLFKYYNSNNGVPSPILLSKAEIYPQSTLTVSQYPLYTQPITSSGANSIWGWPNKTLYPYIITSSNPILIELYNSDIKQIDITGSGFNPISLPWSIEYGDEFRFEGREDFTYQVGKIYSAAESGSNRITETGSIEVQFNRDLPVSASTSSFNLDHFLIRRYVDDASQILIEGFRPSDIGPYIITPEYITPSLDKDIDSFITDLTQKGLL
jgi:hypothetical protein